ncbi:putative VIER F-box protein 2 [Salvia divinorum]|uniref:VIER F-box protein 2 n=1 Tax=Salvia divinorum TaxID=28513 RepID=A0ABD1IJU6_SALDI
MGQTTSSYGYSSGGSAYIADLCLSPHHHHNSSLDSTPPPPDADSTNQEQDYTSEIPDECLALIFQCLSSGDRKRSSLVCRRWLAVDGQSRHRLSLNASGEAAPYLPSIFTRFDSVTKLALRCDRKSTSINDAALALISQRCRSLTRIKLRGCREVSDLGMLALAQNCKNLRKFSCSSCSFGAKGMNALLNNCSSIEELSVSRLKGIDNGLAAESIGPGITSSRLRSITLKELYNGQCFSPLVIESMNLKSLKIIRCLGDWDRLLEAVAGRKNCLMEVHLERLQVSDAGLMAISKCPDLENFHLVKTPDCSNDGISAIAEKCRLLRKLHIDGWRTNRIGDEGLTAIAKNSTNLVELVLIGVNPTMASLTAVASNCLNLERLALCGSDTIGDAEISCIAAKCNSLKKLCIKGCRITDSGIEAFSTGCPNLVKIKVKKCRGVSSVVVDQLRARRESLAVNLDVDEVELPSIDWNTSNAGLQEAEYRGELAQVTTYGHGHVSEGGNCAPSTSNGARSSYKSRFSLLAGRTIAACAFQRLVNGNGSSNDST